MECALWTESLGYSDSAAVESAQLAVFDPRTFAIVDELTLLLDWREQLAGGRCQLFDAPPDAPRDDDNCGSGGNGNYRLTAANAAAAASAFWTRHQCDTLHVSRGADLRLLNSLFGAKSPWADEGFRVVDFVNRVLDADPCTRRQIDTVMQSPACFRSSPQLCRRMISCMSWMPNI